MHSSLCSPMGDGDQEEKQSEFQGNHEKLYRKKKSDQINWTRLESFPIFIYKYSFSMSFKRRQHGERGVI